MPQLLKLSVWVIVISFVGSLPPGILNVSIAGFAANQKTQALILFGLGAILMEILVVRLMLVLMDIILKKQAIFNSIKWITVVILLLFASYNITAALTMRAFQPLPQLVNNAFSTGVLLSLLNPLQIPFWLAWTVVLQDRQILTPSAKTHNILVLSIGLGTGFAFLLYLLLGQFLIEWLYLQQQLINWAIGITLFCTGIIIATKNVKKINY